MEQSKNIMDLNEIIFLNCFLRNSKKDIPSVKQPISTSDFDFFSDNNNYQPKVRRKSLSNMHSGISKIQKKNYVPTTSKVFKSINNKKDYDITEYLGTSSSRCSKKEGNILRMVPKLKSNFNDIKDNIVSSEMSSEENRINDNNIIITSRSNSMLKELCEQKIKNVRI